MKIKNNETKVIPCRVFVRQAKESNPPPRSQRADLARQLLQQEWAQLTRSSWCDSRRQTPALHHDDVCGTCAGLTSGGALAAALLQARDEPVAQHIQPAEMSDLVSGPAARHGQDHLTIEPRPGVERTKTRKINEIRECNPPNKSFGGDGMPGRFE